MLNSSTVSNLIKILSVVWEWYVYKGIIKIQNKSFELQTKIFKRVYNIDVVWVHDVMSFDVTIYGSIIRATRRFTWKIFIVQIKLRAICIIRVDNYHKHSSKHRC